MDIVASCKAAITGRNLRVVLPGARTIGSSRQQHACTRGLARPIVLASDVRTTQARIASLSNGPVGAVTVLDPETADVMPRLTAYVAANRDRMNERTAARLVRKPLYFAGALVALGEADAMVAGVGNPTRRVIEAGLMTIGPAAGIATPSSYFLMMVPGAERPDHEHSYSQTAPSTRTRPLRSLPTSPSPPRPARNPCCRSRHASHCCRSRPTAAPRIRASRRCARHFHWSNRASHLLIDGELQADAALSATVASKKIKGESAVAGRANVLVFPDLDAGNIGYKLTQELAGAQAIGPFLQGFARPVSDLSRGARVDDIVATVAVTLARVPATA